ncbi:predicted protein [Postia placenta Mad-698-R]|nr:predicted protein [Postia placenta Mad-698-R]
MSAHATVHTSPGIDSPMLHIPTSADLGDLVQNTHAEAETLLVECFHEPVEDWLMEATPDSKGHLRAKANEHPQAKVWEMLGLTEGDNNVENGRDTYIQEADGTRLWRPNWSMDTNHLINKQFINVATDLVYNEEKYFRHFKDIRTKAANDVSVAKIEQKKINDCCCTRHAQKTSERVDGIALFEEWIQARELADFIDDEYVLTPISASSSGFSTGTEEHHHNQEAGPNMWMQTKLMFALERLGSIVKESEKFKKQTTNPTQDVHVTKQPRTAKGKNNVFYAGPSKANLRPPDSHKKALWCCIVKTTYLAGLQGSTPPMVNEVPVWWTTWEQKLIDVLKECGHGDLYTHQQLMALADLPDDIGDEADESSIE